MIYYYQVLCVCVCVCVCVCIVTQSYLTLCDPMDYSKPGSYVHGILQARILEGLFMPFSKGSSQPRDRTQVPHIAGRFFTIWATKEAHIIIIFFCNSSLIKNLLPFKNTSPIPVESCFLIYFLQVILII